MKVNFFSGLMMKTDLTQIGKEKKPSITLTDNYIRILDELGFVWKSKDTQSDKAFRDRSSPLKE